MQIISKIITDPEDMRAIQRRFNDTNHLYQLLRLAQDKRMKILKDIHRNMSALHVDHIIIPHFTSGYNETITESGGYVIHKVIGDKDISILDEYWEPKKEMEIRTGIIHGVGNQLADYRWTYAVGELMEKGKASSGFKDYDYCVKLSRLAVEQE